MGYKVEAEIALKLEIGCKELNPMSTDGQISSFPLLPTPLQRLGIVWKPSLWNVSESSDKMSTLKKIKKKKKTASSEGRLCPFNFLLGLVLGWHYSSLQISLLGAL